MPAPAVYILAIVTAVAAGFAFKEFVYEPHIAPKVEQWAEDFIAKRRARRQRAQPIPAIPSSSGETTSSKRGKHPDPEDDTDQTRQSIELENLVAREVVGWRAEVSRSQTGLRHRVNTARERQGLSEGSSTAVNNVPSVVESPTHILFDPNLPLTPTSSAPSAGPTPSPLISTLRETSSSPSPAPTNHTTSPDILNAPLLSPTTTVPSLSQSYAPDLEHEQGIEFLSAPSSRPDSPFSSVSQPLSPHDTGVSSSNYYSFSSPNALSPHNATSPMFHSPSRTLSDIDFLSEFDPLSPRSSASNIPPLEGGTHVVDDEMRSDDGSGSSWASANVRSG